MRQLPYDVLSTMADAFRYAQQRSASAQAPSSKGMQAGIDALCANGYAVLGPDERAHIARLVSGLLEVARDGGTLDGFDVQEMLTAANILRPETITVLPCGYGDACVCAEVGAVPGEDACYRLTEFGMRCRAVPEDGRSE